MSRLHLIQHLTFVVNVELFVSLLLLQVNIDVFVWNRIDKKLSWFLLAADYTAILKKEGNSSF